MEEAEATSSSGNNEQAVQVDNSDRPDIDELQVRMFMRLLRDLTSFKGHAECSTQRNCAYRLAHRRSVTLFCSITECIIFL